MTSGTILMDERKEVLFKFDTEKTAERLNARYGKNKEHFTHPEWGVLTLYRKELEEWKEKAKASDLDYGDAFKALATEHNAKHNKIYHTHFYISTFGAPCGVYKPDTFHEEIERLYDFMMKGILV